MLVKGAEAGDPHVGLFVVLVFATGARHTAVLDLTWDRIDFVRGTIQFDEDLPPDPMSKAWRKGRATVPMNRGARKALGGRFYWQADALRGRARRQAPQEHPRRVRCGGGAGGAYRAR